jgi:hypothetical protein
MSDYIRKSALIEILEKSMKENNHKSMIGYAEHIQEHRYLIHLVEKQPTLDEKEIIRKAFERVVDKLCDLQPFLTADGQYVSLYEVVQTIKKEYGINE